MFAIRTSTRYKGHAVYVAERLHKQHGRSHHLIRCYMVAGATAGEIVLSERNVQYVSVATWLLMLALTGASYKGENK